MSDKTFTIEIPCRVKLDGGEVYAPDVGIVGINIDVVASDPHEAMNKLRKTLVGALNVVSSGTIHLYGNGFL